MSVSIIRMTTLAHSTLRPTLLVTGASGFLGWHICNAATQAWRVVACYNATQPAAMNAVELRCLDLCDSRSVSACFDRVKPDAVIHAAALSQPNACEVDPGQSQSVNVDATRQLAELCRHADIPLVFTSSDLVFDGQSPPYREDDATSPIAVYGRHKVLAEQAVLGLVPKGIVCRMPLMFGDRDGEPASFMGPWLRMLRDGGGLTLFVDEVRTPVSGHSAATGILLVLAAGARGIFHMGGSESISRYDFGVKLAEAFDLPSDSIRKAALADITMAAPRSPDVSLDSQKSFALGYAPGSLDDQLTSVRQSMAAALR